MANFVVLQAIYTKIVESIQTQRIQVKLSNADQKLEEKKSRKCMENGALQEIWRAAKISQAAKFHSVAKLPSPCALFKFPTLFLLLV